MVDELLHEREKSEELLLSVILPAFRCSALLLLRVPKLSKYLDDRGVRHEIIISDDGSGEGPLTREAAGALGCLYVESDMNRGKGAAVARGMRLAQGRYRLFTDSDIPYGLDSVLRAIERLESTGCDVVVGDRGMADSSESRPATSWRRLASALFSFVVARAFNVATRDTQCGFKAFRAEAAERLFGACRIGRFATDVEVLFLAERFGYDVQCVPVSLDCSDGTSVRPFRDGFQMVFDLARIRWYGWTSGYPEARRLGQ